MTSRNYAIVGGGMLGLTLALRLNQVGHRVTVFEAASQIGGLASAWCLGDVVWDRHYHVTLLSDSRTRAVMSELGLGDEFDWVVTKTGCYGDGRLFSVSNIVEYVTFPLLGLVDKARLAATILRAAWARDWRSLERMTVESWLRRWSGNHTYERFWKPLLLSKLGRGYEQTSAAFIWATIQRLYAARRSGMKQELFGYVRGGYARILDQFQKVLTNRGVAVVLDARIRSVRQDASAMCVAHDDGRVDHFDRVIVTTAPVIATKLCPELSVSEVERLERVNYLGIVCASMLLKRGLGGYYVTNLVDAGFPFTGVIEMSALAKVEMFNGQHLVYLPRYLAPGDNYAAKTDVEIENEFFEGLQRIYPDLTRNDILAFRISRVRNVMPIPSVGYSTTVAPFTSSVRGLYLVNSSQIVNGTLNVNETITLAERAVATVTSP